MKRLVLFLAAGTFAACQHQESVPPIPTAGSTVVIASKVPAVRDLASKRALSVATIQAQKAIMQPNWRTATDALDRLREANRGATWLPQFEMAMGNLLLATHFAHRDALTTEQAAIAGRYADVLLGLDGARSDALSRTVVALQPHWTAQRFNAAARTVLARSAEGRCDGCEAMPPEVAVELEAGARAQAASSAEVGELTR